MPSVLSRFSIDRPITSYTKVQNVVGGVLRGRSFFVPRTRRRAGGYVNVGCGTRAVSGFVNLDYHWRPGVDVCWDITRPLPFESDSVQGIFSEHCLEHVPFEACASAIRDFFRVLVPGGNLRLVLPDAELYLDLYARAKNGEDVQFPYHNVNETPMMSVNRIFRNYGHLFAYDVQTLTRLLEGAGFTKIARARFREGRDPQLVIDEESRAVESLYLEATKPAG